MPQADDESPDKQARANCAGIARLERALAVETSGRIGSVALCEGGNVVAERQFPHGLKHAAEMLPMIDRLCADRASMPADLREIYVSAGPGSFTGLRIGITFAKTLAFATGARIVAVPSLEVLVRNAPAEARHAIIVLDAKRDQIFTARFERLADGSWQTGEAAKVDSLAAMLDRSPRPVWLLGDGIPFHQKFLPANPEVQRIIIAPPELWQARAAAVAERGMELANAGLFADPYRLTPIYIRRPEAEEKYENQCM